MTVTTMAGSGELTIPEEIRTHLQLTPGDKVELSPDGEGRVVMRRARIQSITDLFGILPAGSAPLTLEAMDDAIADGIIERARRSLEK
jgi:AbrB family looped-hinge helix DNA binding protein